jgi:hypothetical protein
MEKFFWHRLHGENKRVGEWNCQVERDYLVKKG